MLVCNAKVMGTIHFNVVICCHLRELMQILKELVKVKLYITPIQVCMDHSRLNLIDTDS